MGEFATEYEALFASAYRVAFRLLGVRAEAEDVASETAARAFLRWNHIEAYGQAWVCRVAANLAVDALRRRLRRGEPIIAHSESAVGAHDPADADRRLDLYRSLRGLARRQREVVVLRYLADMSEEDVARALGCSVGTVKTHASRGLAALRALTSATGG